MYGQDPVIALQDWMRTHFFGLYRGTVKDVDDPLQEGRLKVHVPGVFQNNESAWAKPCVPYAGDGVGFKVLPPVDTNVWVQFEQGNINQPVWLGFWWGTGEMPSEAGSGADVKLWKTDAFTIVIDDAAGEMTITANDGGKLTISSEVKAEVSGASHTVATGGVTTECTAKKIEVTQASVSINGGALEIM
ncbi:MAG: baseplate assembly protein [Chloroflexi bacterium]|nr:baseplate assembly protein [Chloroflexota bacterium]